jgi:DNA modification methylase
LGDSDFRNKRSVWTVPTVPYSGPHFAVFPPKLIEPCILAGCPVGGIVLDPFGGSGTTGRVATEHRRNAILIELNPEYINLQEKRTSNVQVKMF